VPLLVVSEYTPAATISGKVTQYPPTYPPQPQWTHDFGSILRFTETNFTQQGVNLPTIAPHPYTYADQNTLDSTYNQKSAVPLWDFFLAWPTPRQFTYIIPIDSTHNANFFESYYQTQQADGTYPQPLGPEEIAPGVDDPLD
jgi:hypothetical protein